MKVFLVWEIRHMMPWPVQKLMGIFRSEERAKNQVAYLTLGNKFPMESDEYGPYGGIEYKYYESDVLD